MRYRRGLLFLHRWMALLFAVPLLLAVLSGVLLTAGKPLDEWLNRQRFQAPSGTAVSSPAVDAVLVQLKQRYGHDARFTLRLPQQPGESLRVFVKSEHFSGMAFYDPANAAWLGERGHTQGWWPWLFELHSELLLGDTGQALLSASAVGLLLLLLTGGLAAWPVSRSSGLRIAWQAPSPRRWRDLHRVFGLLLLPLFIAIIATGVYMAWKPVRGWVSMALGYTPVKPPRLPALSHNLSLSAGITPPPLSALVGRAHAPWAAGRVVYVSVRPGEPVRIRVKLPHDPHPNGLSSAWFDPRDGRELARVRVEQLDPGQRWVSWIYALHSAQWFGTPHRIAWTLLGTLLLALAGTGLWLWWQRTFGKRGMPLASASILTPLDAPRANLRIGEELTRAAQNPASRPPSQQELCSKRLFESVSPVLSTPQYLHGGVRSMFLSELPLEQPARVVAVRANAAQPEWQRQLADIGFTPGEQVCVLRRAFLAGDPMVVRIGRSTFALRQAEAACVEVESI